jgi:hypothetical protein
MEKIASEYKLCFTIHLQKCFPFLHCPEVSEYQEKCNAEVCNVIAAKAESESKYASISILGIRDQKMQPQKLITIFPMFLCSSIHHFTCFSKSL